MLHKIVIVLAITAALIAGLTADALARGGFGGGAHMGGGGRSGFVRNPTTLFGSQAPQMPAFAFGKRLTTLGMAWMKYSCPF